MVEITVGPGTILSHLTREINDIRKTGGNIEFGEFYELVLCTVTKTLATKMMSDEDMLLSTLYQLFKDTVGVEAKII